MTIIILLYLYQLRNRIPQLQGLLCKFIKLCVNLSIFPLLLFQQLHLMNKLLIKLLNVSLYYE